MNGRHWLQDDPFSLLWGHSSRLFKVPLWMLKHHHKSYGSQYTGESLQCECQCKLVSYQCECVRLRRAKFQGYLEVHSLVSIVWGTQHHQESFAFATRVVCSWVVSVVRSFHSIGVWRQDEDFWFLVVAILRSSSPYKWVLSFWSWSWQDHDTLRNVCLTYYLIYVLLILISLQILKKY